MYMLGKVYMSPTHEPLVQKSYERFLFNINLFCSHVCIKLCIGMAQ